MAAEVLPLAQLKQPQGPNPVTAEQRYWKSFKNQRLHTSTASWPITHLSFAGGSPGAIASSTSPTAAVKESDLFAVTTGMRVDLYSIRKRELVRTIGRFQNVAYGGCIRSDGRVLVAGDNAGKMQVFDVSGTSRAAILKTWNVHKQPVWVTRWSPTELTMLMSGSDDKTVRLWDLPSNEPKRTLHGHADYVRSGDFVPNSGGNLFASGSYDQTVRVWDARVPGGSVLTFKHNDPIETVLPLISGTTLLAAAGNTVTVLDLVAARPLHLITNHQKTVTSLCLASHGQRILSGGLDGHVKVYDTVNWNVVAGSKYPSPIICLSVITAGASQDDRHIAVGMQSGVLSLRTRLSGRAAEMERARAAEQAAQDLGGGALEQLDAQRVKRKRDALSAHAMEQLGETADAVIETARRGGKRAPREPRWQRDLRHGRYAASLDAVVDMGAPDYQADTALMVLAALRHRSALREALEGRDEVSVQPLLRFAAKHLMAPRFTIPCVDMALHLLDLYGEYAGSSAELAAGFKFLLDRVRLEVDKSQLAIVTNGMVESLMMNAVA